jgi:hypothetical protein
MRARRGGTRAKRAHTHTHSLAGPGPPPRQRGGKSLDLCKIPDNPPPRQKERGVSAPGNVGRAQNALYAHTHTHTAGPGPPPRQCLDARRQEGGLRKGGTGAHGAL